MQAVDRSIGITASLVNRRRPTWATDLFSDPHGAASSFSPSACSIPLHIPLALEIWAAMQPLFAPSPLNVKA